MTVVHIEHPVKDFAAWKAAFDQDPADRRGSGVRRYTIACPIDDPRYVIIDLEFGNDDEASAFLVTMGRVWSSAQATDALAGPPAARILTVVEHGEP